VTLCDAGFEESRIAGVRQQAGRAWSNDSR